MWAHHFLRVCLVPTCSLGRAGAADTPCLCLPDLTARGPNSLMTKSFRAAAALCGIHLTISMDYSPQIIVPALSLYLLSLLCPSTASLLMSHILRWSLQECHRNTWALSCWMAGRGSHQDWHIQAEFIINMQEKHLLCWNREQPSWISLIDM